MNLDFLKEPALELGADVTQWPRAERLAAAIGLYKASPEMFADALGDLSADLLRNQVLDGFEAFQSNAFEGAQMLAATLVIWLRDWPARWLQAEIEKVLPAWQAEAEREDWISELEARADAARENRWLS